MKLKSNNLRNKAISGMIWKLSEKIGMQLVQLIIQIVLARILMPEEYGLVGLLTIFISIADVFILQGFTTALIQKKNADELDYSSVFYANLIMSALLYIALFTVSPAVAWFYKDERLTALMRILSLNVLLGAFSAVHNAIMQKKLEFKKSFVRNISNIFTQGIVGITAAIMGAGAWALVLSKLAGTLVGSVVICSTVKWKPSRTFSLSRIKVLFKYSSNLLGTNLLNTVFNNMHSIIIGRFFSKAELGFYQRGQQIPQVAMTAIDGSLSEVLYPTLSILQNDKERLKSALRRTMKTSMFIALPLMAGLTAIAEPLTILLLTDKWLPSVPFMQLSCVVCMFWPLSARGQALNAIGKSNVTFKLSLVSKAITLVMIVLCIRLGIYTIMIGTIIAAGIGMVITSYYVKKHIGYTYMEFMIDMLPIVLISAIMFALVLIIGRINFNVPIKLIVQVLVGIISYVILSKLFKVDSEQYIENIIKSILKRK